MLPPVLTLEPQPYDGPAAAVLIAELQAEYTVRYGGPDQTPIDVADFTPPDGVYFVARSGADVIGSAALRRHDAVTAELKRMYVRAAFRRRGLGRALLTATEEAARERGYRRLILETGTRQPEAIDLYVSAGYEPIPSFGMYRDSPSNRCFGRDL